ncbi:MAG: hypothetical protein LR017_02260 [Candidatus Pacebacteria bacterium]|nr:hypothetical protein [Candidatus Paceibacterota bacterium]
MLVCHLPYEEAERRIRDRMDVGGEHNSFDCEHERFKRAVRDGMQRGQQHLCATYTFHGIDAQGDEHAVLHEARTTLGYT